MPREKSRRTIPNGECAVCQHHERIKIEVLLASGAGQRSVADKYKLNRHAVGRHWRHHVSEEQRSALRLGPVQVQALAAQVAEESGSLIDHYRAVRAGLYSLFSAAVTAGDGTVGSLLAGKLVNCLNAIGKVTGEIANSPLVQINQQINFTRDPEFARFQANLVRVLNQFPEARAAVVAEFQRIDAEHAALPAVVSDDSQNPQA